MLIIDGDYPMAYGSVDADRDLTQSISEVRSAEPGIRGQFGPPDSETMATLPEMRRGSIAAALVKVAARIERPGSPLWGYRSSRTAYAAAQAHLAYYRILDSVGEARILRSRGEFIDHMRIWSETSDHEKLPVGFIVGMEGADPILNPQHVHDWWEGGVRVVSLSHYGVSTYCHGTGTGTEGGLFPMAAELLKEMESLGMILDLTHASDRSAREALDLFSGPILASHQNCRELVPGERQFPDDLLTAVIQRDGIIGASMDTWMLYKPGIDWTAKIPSRRTLFPRDAITLDDLVDHIDHVCQLAGNSLHAGIGGDTDGQGGREGAPLEIDTVADYQKLADVLDRRGYTQEDIANVMYRNWQRFFADRLPAE
ncbi:MAG: dipeptidase [Fuerstiella sp.]|nr:dipeptidase [Fuerstiella sp.]